MSYGDIDLGQHWLRWWLVAWQYQAITWTIVDFPLITFCGIHMGAISQCVLKLLFCIMSLKFIVLKLLPQHPGANESKLISFPILMAWCKTMATVVLAIVLPQMCSKPLPCIGSKEHIMFNLNLIHFHFLFFYIVYYVDLMVYGIQHSLWCFSLKSFLFQISKVLINDNINWIITKFYKINTVKPLI